MEAFKFPRAIVPEDRIADALALERTVNQQARVFKTKGFSRKQAAQAAYEHHKDDIRRFQSSLPFVERMKAAANKLKAPEPAPSKEIPTAYI